MFTARCAERRVQSDKAVSETYSEVAPIEVAATVPATRKRNDRERWEISTFFGSGKRWFHFWLRQHADKERCLARILTLKESEKILLRTRRHGVCIVTDLIHGAPPRGVTLRRGAGLHRPRKGTQSRIRCGVCAYERSEAARCWPIEPPEAVPLAREKAQARRKRTLHRFPLGAIEYG